MAAASIFPFSSSPPLSENFAMANLNDVEYQTPAAVQQQGPGARSHRCKLPDPAAHPHKICRNLSIDTGQPMHSDALQPPLNLRDLPDTSPLMRAPRSN